ncbi:YugN family protein [Chungangia koreensis]|uniref:YugN family protein n=1 Tax=Chungangia koreensis TaxID=752657 RepID=A0ABV8X1W2_9LACT
MYFENSGIENTVAEQKLLTEIMAKHGFVFAEQYDYERATFDKKIILKEGTYYLRIFGAAIEGDVGVGNAIIQLKKPVLGKHYYPHGVEYGDDENFPNHLVKASVNDLIALKEDLKPFEIHA